MSLPLYLPAALLLTSISSAAQVQDLGTIPVSGLTTVSQANDVSRDGQVVVGLSTDLTSDLAAFAWTESTGLTRLDDPQSPFILTSFQVSGDGSVAVGGALQGGNDLSLRWDLATGAVLPIVALPYPAAISDDGSSIAGVWLSVISGTRAGRWSLTDGLEDLGGSATAASAASDMSGDGSVIVGTLRILGTPTVPFRWTEATGLIPLAGFIGDCRPDVRVSRDGQVIAGITLGPGMTLRAFRWTAAGGFTDLGTMAGGFISTTPALLLNDDGSVIAGVETFGPQSSDNGWRWTQATGMTRLSPFSEVIPTAISADGTVLSCVERGAAGARPARWTLSGGLTTLAPLNPSIIGGLSYTTGMSADGSAIVGQSNANQLFQSHATLWREDGTIGRSICSPGVPNSTGPPGEIRLTGTNHVATGALTIEASSLPPGAFGFFICSRLEGFSPTPGGSQGNLCLGGAIGRYVGPGQVQSATAAGEFTLTIDPAMLVQPNGPVAPTYGESWFFQAWHRDANPTSTSNFTDAAAVRLY